MLQTYNGAVHAADTIWYGPTSKVESVHNMGLVWYQYEYVGLGAVLLAEEGYYQPVSGQMQPFMSSAEGFLTDGLGNKRASLRMIPLGSNYTWEYDTLRYAPGTMRLLRQVRMIDDAWQWDEVPDDVYDGAGNLRYGSRIRSSSHCVDGDAVVCRQWEPFNFQETTGHYYTADGKLFVTDVHVTGGTGEFPHTERTTGGYEEFRYDALGRRILRRFRSDKVMGQNPIGYYVADLYRYVWDGEQMLYEIKTLGLDDPETPGDELEDDGASTTRYGRVVYTHGPVLDQPLGVIRADEPKEPSALYLDADWRGQIAMGTWRNGLVDESPVNRQYTLVDWSERRISTEGDRLSAFNDAYLPGARWMGSLMSWEETGTRLVYMRNRYYDPVSGRFTQEDPIGLAGGLNLYGFAGGDPVNFSDPFGLCPPVESCQLMAMMARWAGTTSDGPSNDRIAQLEPEVAIKANLLMNISEHVNGDALRVTHGYRSVEEQDALYAQGKTAPGEIVTNARGGESEHNFGRAFDVAFKMEGGRALGRETGRKWVRSAPASA